MQAKATIIKVETRIGAQSQKEFTVIDLAENFFSGEDRKTTYWRGLLFKDDLRALVKKGQKVTFTGMATPKPFSRGDGTPGAEMQVHIFTLKVDEEPKARSENSGTASNAAQSQPAAQGQQQPSAEPSAQDEDYERYSQMVDSNFA
jgi:hypothetical protein